MTNDESVATKKLKLWNPAIDEKHEEVNIVESTKQIPNSPSPKMSNNPNFNTQFRLLFQNYMQLTRPHIAQLPVNNLVAYQQSPMIPSQCQLPMQQRSSFLPPVISERITVNPLVQNALGAVPTPNHNCCAICGCAFRLTTDLVQHMRLNHRSSKYKRSQKRIH